MNCGWLAGSAAWGAARTPWEGGSGLPMPTRVTVTESLTLLEAISLTECLVCSVSSWSKHQSSSSSVSRESFWWASSAGGTGRLGKGPASSAATRHGGAGAAPNPRPHQHGGPPHPPAGRRGTRGDTAGVGVRHPWGSVTLSPWRGSPGTRRATLSPWGDSQPRGQARSRGAPLTAGVLLMEGLTSTGAFPPPRRAARREELPKTRHGSRRAKPQLCLGSGGEFLHPQGTARHTLGTQGQPARPKISPPPSPLGTHRRGWPCSPRAGCCSILACETQGAEEWDPRSGAPSPAVGWGPRSGDILALPPPAHSLDASAVLEVGQVAADGAEAGQDLEGGERGLGSCGHPPGHPPGCWVQAVSPPGQGTAVAPTWAKGVTIMSSPCLREHREREGRGGEGRGVPGDAGWGDTHRSLAMEELRDMAFGDRS